MKKILFSSAFVSLLVMAINFGFKLYAAHFVGKHTLGMFYTMIDVIGLGVMVFSGFRDSLVRAFDRPKFCATAYWYTVAFWGIFGVVSVGMVWYANHFTELSWYVPYGIYTLNAAVVFVSYWNAAYKAYRVMLFENMVASTCMVISFSMVLPFVEGMYALSIAIMGSLAARLGYIFWLSPLRFHICPMAISHAKTFFKQTGLSSMMYLFSGFFVAISGVLIWKLFHDMDTLANYQVVVKSIFFSLIGVFVFPLTTYLFPHLSGLVAKKDANAIARIEAKLIKYLVVMFAIVLTVLPLTPWLINLLFPETYKDAYTMLNWLLPLLPLIAYTTFSLNLLKAYDRFDLALSVRILGSILFISLVGAFYLAGTLAKYAIAWGFDATYIAMFLVAWYMRRRIIQ